MTVFVSYSSRDKDAVKSLVSDLQDADEQVWMDRRLAGGQAWWRAILDQIRGCDVFTFALSQNSLDSKPCQAELHYAQTLGLPILPVQVGPVDSMQLNPLAAVHSIDYRHQTPNTGMRLITALHRERGRRQPLPDPLPDEPPVPFEYLIRLYTTISHPDYLTPRDQAALIAQLQVGLGEDGQHEAARNDIAILLTKLHDREDATHRTRTDVEAILASIGADSRTQAVAPSLVEDRAGSGTHPLRSYGEAAYRAGGRAQQPPPAPSRVAQPLNRNTSTDQRAVSGTASAISRGTFAWILLGVVLVSFSVAHLLLPTHSYDDRSVSARYIDGGPTLRILYGLFAFGSIPGIVFMVLGRGRAHPDRTMWGCGLVSLGLTAGLRFGLHLSGGRYVLILVVAGLLMILGPTFLRRPSRGIVAGCLFYGAAIVALVVVEQIFQFLHYLEVPSPAISAATGLVLIVAGAIGCRMTREASTVRPVR